MYHWVVYGMHTPHKAFSLHNNYFFLSYYILYTFLTMKIQVSAYFPLFTPVHFRVRSIDERKARHLSPATSAIVYWQLDFESGPVSGE